MTGSGFAGRLTSLSVVNDLPARFADLLEQSAIKVRSLTVDRVAGWIRIGGLGILAAALGFITVVFLLFGIFGALEIPLTTAGALGVIGALLLGAGGIIWFKRT
jgi:hypothetical protein